MVSFSVSLGVTFILVGCPESGLEALDWRRAHGFSERLDNLYRVSIYMQVPESTIRQLVAAGWVLEVTHPEEARIAKSSLPTEFDPERGTIPITLEKPGDPVALLCLAHSYRALEAARAALTTETA